MSQPDDIATNDHRNLRRLISLWYDGGITPSEFAKLQDLLKESAQFRSVFWAYAEIQSRLTTDGTLARERDVMLLPSFGKDGGNAAVSQPAGRLTSYVQSLAKWHAGALAAAVVVLLLCRLGWSLLDRSDAPSVVASEKSILARVVEMSEDCKWLYDIRGEAVDASSDEGNVLRGSTLRVVEGDLKLVFSNGVEMRLFGPALLEADSEMRTHLLSGHFEQGCQMRRRASKSLCPRRR